ncbi:MAG TPA: DUF192 domain-containing protein [Ignavibacteria bacterium]|nr:DUF192 domain-containing protein [Ignavibacteria bacterium]HRK00527.1 DUF192 domain-containing protein [Ignavibacteria bacterium]
MSKNRKEKIPHKKSSDAGISKYILFAVILIIAGYFFYDLLIREESVKPPVFKDPQERIKNVPEPQFKKEGELEFISADGKNSVIKKIDIELALDDSERTQGLMYRKSMDDEKGMLFIFDREEMQSFWMKNTIIPLDIMYVNSDFKIVKIFKNTVPFSEISLPSDRPAIYVVEVAGGFSDRYKIKEGDKIKFEKF